MKNNLKKYRKDKGFTQEGFAELLGVSRQTVISVESGRYVPSTVLSLKMAEFLNQKVEDLFELESSDFEK
ncbi:helix-turn-helix transcriptional regulator [Tenacibaculum xiamenense]|uniref:helix-turn-helix transcriptional regulator n=1 Tax=Tenacibaculum xiamenense TaxID=1261553 RepID=UPI003895CE32